MLTKKLIRGGILLGLLGAMACGAAPPRAAGPTLPPEAYMPSGATWVGKWITSLGPLDIIHMNRTSGFDFAGAYEREVGNSMVSGVFTANAENNTIRLQWVENRNGVRKSGKAIWRMNADGTSFAGMWGKGNSATDGGRWEGRRDDPNRPDVTVMR